MGETKTYTPTYLSVPRIEKVLELLSSRNFSTVDRKTFKAEEFSDSDAALAVSTLKFLGFIDDNGEATERMVVLSLDGDARKQEFEQVFRNAYKALFAVVKEPQNLSTEELANEMVRQYELTPRLVPSAVKAFFKLCEYAGLKEEGSIVSKPRTSRQTTQKMPPSKQRGFKQQKNDSLRTNLQARLTVIPVVEGRLIIGLENEAHTKALFDQEAGDDLRTLLHQARSYADKHLSDDNPSK